MKERAWKEKGSRVWRMKTITIRAWITLTSSQVRNGRNGKDEKVLNLRKTLWNRFKSVKDFTTKRRRLDD